ncbi:MAG: GAF domain-containing protein [Dehalococcoidia bacterium]
MPEDDRSEALDLAHERIREQEAELRTLREQAASLAGLGEFREALESVAIALPLTAGTAGRTLYHLIVETAASVLNAEAASLFLIDPDTDELVFEVALGQPDAEAERWRLDAGTGIVGLVAATGQPMAITDPASDPRHAGNVAARMGRTPRNILCVPLFLEGEVVGVLELLDKRGTAGFTPADVSTMGLFANQAAVAIMQSRAHSSLLAFLRNTAGGSAVSNNHMLDEAPEVQRAIQLAKRVRALVGKGEREERLANAVLQAVTDYVEARG